MSDGFTGEDRKNLTNVCRDVKWMKGQYEKRMDEIEERRASGERRLHERVDEVHCRVNKVRNLFIGLTGSLSLIAGALAAWVRLKLTGGN